MNKLITVSDARTLAALAEEKAIKLEMDAEAMFAADPADAEGSAQAAQFTGSTQMREARNCS